MYHEVIIRTEGDSVVIDLPRAMLERHQLGAENRLVLVETPDGILITHRDSALFKAGQVAARGAETFRTALRRLAE